MREIDIIIDGRRADTYRDESVTLDFNSSILGDISSIKCSASKTIRLPKTLNNDAIFDLAHMPSRDSAKARKVLSCEMYVDGVTVFSRGLCHLLSSDGDHYEVAMTFGIMHQGFEQWLKDKPKLRDLQQSETDSIAWKAGAGLSLWYGGESQDEQMEGMPSLWYARYDCGVNDTTKINIHPCVTLREVYARVIKQNALPMNMPQSVVEDMAGMAIVLKNNNTSLQTLERDLVIQERPYYIASGLENDEKRIQLNILNSDFFNVQTSSFVHSGYRKVTVTIGEIYLSLPVVSGVGEGGADFKTEALASPYDYALVIKPANQSVIVVNPSATLYDNTVVYRVNRTIEVEMSEEDNGKDAVQVYVKIKRWSSLPTGVIYTPNYMANGDIIVDNDIITPDYKNWTTPLRDALKFSRDAGLLSYVSYTYENNSNNYPLQEFRLVPNLPDITQIDFINFLCKYYGMFPMQDGDSVALVPFSRLYDNIDANSIYDWSEKLTESYLYYPNSVGLTIDGYAQRNVITYKEDKKDPVDVSASLVVEDESLEQDKKLIEFPFAASRGNLIPQYSLNDEGELQKNDVEYRIMRITYGENYENNALKFTDDMKCQQILNRHYSEMQDAIRKPMQIEEDVTLSLLDLQKIDYSRPVYLSKYGRYFAIISIQWQSNQQTCRVKLLRIK